MPKIELVTPLSLSNDSIEQSVVPVEWLLDNNMLSDNFIENIPESLVIDMATNIKPVVGNKFFVGIGTGSFYQNVTRPLLDAIKSFRKYSVEETNFSKVITFDTVQGVKHHTDYPEDIEVVVKKPRNYVYESHNFSFIIQKNTRTNDKVRQISLGVKSIDDLGDEIKIKIWIQFRGVEHSDEALTVNGSIRLKYRVLI